MCKNIRVINVYQYGDLLLSLNITYHVRYSFATVVDVNPWPCACISVYARLPVGGPSSVSSQPVPLDLRAFPIL